MNRSIPFAMILGLLAGCASPDPFAGRDYLNCRTADQLESLPALQATVEKIHPCGVMLKTEDGRSLTLAGPLGGDPLVTHFMKTLEQRRTYTFPADFLAFKERENTPNKAIEDTAE